MIWPSSDSSWSARAMMSLADPSVETCSPCSGACSALAGGADAVGSFVAELGGVVVFDASFLAQPAAMARTARSDSKAMKVLMEGHPLVETACSHTAAGAAGGNERSVLRAVG